MDSCASRRVGSSSCFSSCFFSSFSSCSRISEALLRLCDCNGVALSALLPFSILVNERAELSSACWLAQPIKL
ncbi:hypothetical protein EJ02DRAFT_26931 [Clathrospora elynae]|uniref:Uncharacterized protein n=1 Tax=Clathrospora elynae TaxID=706981 RepID=A0A6A5SFF2_9PLEO|nr:hypothetical protein EJ02DRAFT_26931 [Clathrospora elynae]